MGSRFSWTFFGFSVASVLFWVSAAFLYAYVGTFSTNPDFIPFADAAAHPFGMNHRSWLIIFIVPVVATLVDVVLKLFANLYFPNQTQIHMEIAAKEDKEKVVRSGGKYAWC